MSFAKEVICGSPIFETVCKHIADLPLADLRQALDNYKSFENMVKRINNDFWSIQQLLRVDHDEMTRLQRCGAFKGYETFEQRFKRYCSVVPFAPQYLNDSWNRYQIRTAILTEAFSIYGTRAYKIADELLSLDAQEIIAFMKDWNIFNEQMKRINE